VFDHLTFLKNFVLHPIRVGAIAPSGPALVRMMVQWFDWATVRSVVEYGPGTGVFTEAIVKNLHADANFFAIEMSPEMAQRTRQRCPGTTVFTDSVSNVGKLCDQQQMGSIEAIVCGLPWAAFPESLQSEILEAMLDRLAPGGRFATFAYLQGVPLPAGRRFAKRLESTFSSVEKSPIVWKNLPPAFIYRCIR
jgi:phosphatidylethanolamine/phosphatidyl-N-methylethanolamine N-methyltransferase